MSNNLHKVWMYRVLTSIVDTPELAKTLRFKGGTCAAMRGFLNRFSVDLDFDIIADKCELPRLRKKCELIFEKSPLEIKDQSSNTLQFFLKYPAGKRERNSLKIDCLIPPPKANKYELIYLPDIDRMVWCQTRETMVANKLVAPLDRFEKNGSIAGRDIFDIHAFLFQGFSYNSNVIVERRNQNISDFFEILIDFINNNITMKTIDQDLNPLLSIDVFKSIRKNLKTETIMLLKTELNKTLTT